MKEVFYKKVGKRYVPVREYDSELLDSFPGGTHLVVCEPGRRSIKYNIDPEIAPLLAAFKISGIENTITSIIVDSSKLRSSSQPLTKEQKQAWEAFSKTMKGGAYHIQYPSAQEIADEIANYITNKILTTMQNESVKKAYDQFEMVFKLAYGDKNDGKDSSF